MSETGRFALTPHEGLSRGPQTRLEDYLNDTVAPLQVAEPVLGFLRDEPEGANRIILQWADQQLALNLHAIPISDLLYHALKKIQVFEELGLADPEEMRSLLETSAKLARAYCPRDELADFDANLARLREQSKLFKAVELLHRAGEEPEWEGPDLDEEDVDLDELRREAAQRRAEQSKADASEVDTPEPDADAVEPPEPTDEELTSPDRRSADLLEERRKRDPDLDTLRQQQVVLGLKRFSMLVTTLERAKEKSVSDTMMPQLLSSAAIGAESFQEFRGYLDRLKNLGLEDLHMEQIVRSVAESIPDWHLHGDGAAQPETEATTAIERIVEFTELESEKTDRLKEIVVTAVEHFNQGRLGSALTLFDLADRLLKNSGLPPFEQQRVRTFARKKLRTGTFRKIFEEPGKHSGLRRVLIFFPDLRVEGLVRRLLKEPSRKNRHFIMELLRIHGNECREAVADIVISSTTLAGREWPWFFIRNLIRLLRDVPADADALSKMELEAIISYADPVHAIQVVREAIAYLGTVEHPRAREALIQRFHEYCDTSRQRREGGNEDSARIRSLALSYLLRSSDVRARSAALDYALSGSRESVGSGQLLGVLGSVNLSSDRGSLDRLLRAIRMRLRGEGLAGKIQNLWMRLPQDGLGGKFRGLGRAQKEQMQGLIQALSGTPLPEVTELLTQVEKLRPSRDLEALARKTRSKLEELELEVDLDSEVTLSGDLQVFGLPDVLQSLSHSEATGNLVVEAKQGTRRAVIRVLYGRFVDAKVGGLRGAEALFFLLEKPLASSFHFVADDKRAAAKKPQDFKSLLFEGMRRRDEFERLRVMVPDLAPVAIAGGEPTLPPDEHDTALAQRLWRALAEEPRSPEACEELGLADAYRVRRLLQHWREGGQLSLEEVPPT